jgi:2-(1,2-epoxy-1,2-dihydrophenyl)acetyl-CoA isomerase
MESRKPAELARALYAALADGDRHQLDTLLHPGFTGRIAEGMPFGIGGDHDGPAAMRRKGWGAIARHFESRAEPEQFLDLADGRLLVTGRYRGPRQARRHRSRRGLRAFDRYRPGPNQVT